jgi:hypothetical protein
VHKIRLQDLFVLMLGLCLAACGQEVSETAPVQAVRRANDIILPLDVDVVDALVPQNATLASILHSHQVSNRNVAAIVEQVDAVFDVRQIKAQHQYRLTQTLNGLPRQFEYHIDSDRFLKLFRTSKSELCWLCVVILTRHARHSLPPSTIVVNKFS